MNAELVCIHAPLTFQQIVSVLLDAAHQRLHLPPLAAGVSPGNLWGTM